MTRHVVTLNAGSSSIKFALFQAEDGRVAADAIGLVEMVGDERRITVRDSAGAKIHDQSWTESVAAPFHADALRRISAGAARLSRMRKCSPPDTVSSMGVFIMTDR